MADWLSSERERERGCTLRHQWTKMETTMGSTTTVIDSDGVGV